MNGCGVDHGDFDIFVTEKFLHGVCGRFASVVVAGFQQVGGETMAVFFPLAVADENLAAGEVYVLDAQAHTFHQPHACAIEQLRHQLVQAGHLVEDLPHFLAGEDDGEALRLFGVDGFDGTEVLMEHFAVEEEQGGEGGSSTSSEPGLRMA
jgi:hypothetical protein